MFSSEQYRAKAAEYKERGKKTDAPNEILEFSNLQRTFTEMADNEQWVEQNYQHIVHGSGNDQEGSARLAAEEEPVASERRMVEHPEEERAPVTRHAAREGRVHGAAGYFSSRPTGFS